MSDPHKSTSSGMAAVTISALGVVFGDIGTSPLYALKECFHGPHAIAINHVNVMGVLSLIFWSLMVVITIKYICFVTKADNQGEGGTFALLAILRDSFKGEQQNSTFFKTMPFLALGSAALLYSDGIITPAISVLSAVEGLNVATPAAQEIVVPATFIILVALFMMQKYGTARIGSIFGPIMVVWFLAIAIIGIINIVENPHVILALSPSYALDYFKTNHIHGIIVLGTVVLCITGGEALYADLGHFSRMPIKNAWLYLVCPALILNYLGQGALLLSNPSAAHNPFYEAVPQPLLYPMVAMATIATVIASQALITGVYSLTQQAMRLGFLPRMQIVHTSSATKGQIYMPTVNNLLMVACLALVLIFKNSSGLAAAYGLAVTGAMGMTSILYFAVVRHAWKWHFIKAVPLLMLFLFFDLPFLAANLLKVLDGGWLPLLASIMIITVMTTWKKGRAHLADSIQAMSMPLTAFLVSLWDGNVKRSPGIGVYLTMNQNLTPMPLTRTAALIHTAPEKIVLLTFKTTNTPFVSSQKRLVVNDRDKEVGVYRMVASYGYMEQPNIIEISELSRDTVAYLPLYDCTFYLGRETILPSNNYELMRHWRQSLFIFLSNNARNASTFFNIPMSRVVEIGTHFEM